MRGQRLIRRVFALLRVDLLFLFAIVFAMVVKPTADDVWAIVIVAAILVAGSAVFLRGIRETSAPEASAVSPSVQELASHTTGSAPSPVQRQSASIVRVTISAWASRWPLELNGTPQQLPATSGGIQTGAPARAETATRASVRVGPAPASLDRPMIRLVQEGK